MATSRLKSYLSCKEGKATQLIIYAWKVRKRAQGKEGGKEFVWHEVYQVFEIYI
jgi:hypothetical protein